MMMIEINSQWLYIVTDAAVLVDDDDDYVISQF